MIKHTHKSSRYVGRVALGVMLMFFTGCQIGLNIDGLYPDDEPGETCGAHFDACVADAGDDPEAISICHDILLACFEGGDSGGWGDTGPYEGGEVTDGEDWGMSESEGGQDWGDTSDGGEDWGTSESEGGEEWGGEWGESESGDECEGGSTGTTGPDDCEFEFQICLDEGIEDPELCVALFEECIGEPPPPPDMCEDLLNQCLGDNPDQPEECFLLFEECIGEPPPPPPDMCEDLLDQCLGDNPNQPEECFLLFEECIGEPPPPPPDDPCLADFEVCLDNAYDEADLILCEEIFAQCDPMQY